MNVVKQVIDAKNNKEIASIIRKAIRKEIVKAYRNNPNKKFIGANLNINPQYQVLKASDIDKNYYEDFEINGSWIGFIPYGVKLTYAWDFRCYYTYDIIDVYHYNFGSYYYLNDFSYIYKFAKFLNATFDSYEEITEDDFLDLVFVFLHDHFDNLWNYRSRDEIHQLILSNDKAKKYYKPVKEHSIHDFENTGGAMCSELASTANNIFNVFNHKCMYLQDQTHAYNMLMIPNKDKKDGYDYYIYDGAYCAKYISYENTEPESIPYIALIEDFDKNSLEKLLAGEIRINTKEYTDYEIRNNVYTICSEDERNYGVYTHSPKQEVKILTLKK